MEITPDLIRRHAAPVPRYTSYPTAPHFSEAVGPETYAGWLGALGSGHDLSLYAHLPFCDTLCWFCGCHTKVTRRYEPVSAYLAALICEIETIGRRVETAGPVRHLHWGGGSPGMLSPEDIARLAGALRRHFRFAPDAEFAIEIDPRGLDGARMDALAAARLTRVSIGVQDLDPKVQAAINRVQSLEETAAAAEGFRARGVSALNIDAIYGLPHQSVAGLEATLRAVIGLKPDRIALFGYAHVPWMKKHQGMIDEAALPDIFARHAQAEAAAELLVAAGYRRIGLDHFALPGDALAVAAATGRLKRNFQGYSVDPAAALIGLGASSIGALPQGYVQNRTATARYMAEARHGSLATERGVAVSAADRLRRQVIETLMCDLVFSRDRLGNSEEAAVLFAEARALMAEDADGFTEPTPDGFRVTERGRPFLRAIAARFDAYLPRRAARHSLGV